MKTISQDYKTNVKTFGRQLDSKITYIVGSEEIELGPNELNSVTPSFESSILKSAMKQLDIECIENIPVGTEVNYKFGVKVDKYIATTDETYQSGVDYYKLDGGVYYLLEVGVDYAVGDAITETVYNFEEYEYIDYGNYIVYESEKQEDTNSYKITCYDKMLYSMKPYEKMNINYPISVRDYISAICNKLGLTFKNTNSVFANYNRQIQSELYLSYNETEQEYINDMGYTFRDVLDELAQVTASTICIDKDDELEIRYITNTADTINEDYLKDINVNFGEKYGPINSIVLSRAGNSDKIYLKDNTSIEQNGLCEINISENQIMNFNDRSNYLPDILSKLDGLEYYLNDFSSTGITYFEMCDRYNIQIDDNTYSCIMFNDEVLVSQGLEENIHTDMPEESETDYTKADKTDRKINQTYIIVDKQNQIIQSVVNNVTDQNNKISQITQTVDEINQKISDIADVTISGESNIGDVILDGINASEPITLKVRPLNVNNNISYLYPHSNLYPSSTLYPKDRKIAFINKVKYEETEDQKYTNYKNYYSYNSSTEQYTLLIKGTDYQVGDTITGTVYQNKETLYEIPDNLLYYDSEHFDEFYLNYASATCQITKRCTYNADGTVGYLQQEVVIDYPYPTIQLEDGDYEIKLLGYDIGYLYVQLMASNIYTTQFATKVEMNSAINQTAREINLVVNQKLDEEDFTHANIVLKINDDTSTAQIHADKVDIDATDVINILSGNTINLTSKNITIDSTNFSVDQNGNMVAENGTFKGSISSGSSITGATINGGSINLSSTGENARYTITDTQDSGCSYTQSARRISWNGLNGGLIEMWNTLQTPIIGLTGMGGGTTIRSYNIETPEVIQTSLEKDKKNFEKFENALDVIKNTDIYKYNLKHQKNKDKKHIGFVIGDKYKYSKEITAVNDDGKEVGVDLYSMTSVCLQAIKEQQEEIETLNKRIEILENKKGDDK